ncbi:MAG: hypothetical protein KDN20_03050 [Verrucomicrobiae bacterium]|nr:hypothetical protein [Verrucomicrobiae bacterium]
MSPVFESDIEQLRGKSFREKGRLRKLAMSRRKKILVMNGLMFVCIGLGYSLCMTMTEAVLGHRSALMVLIPYVVWTVAVSCVFRLFLINPLTQRTLKALAEEGKVTT